MVEQTKSTVNSRSDLRERIVAMASDAFRERGVKGMKMDDLAAQLGISKRTLYELFGDKESLLVACIQYNQKIGEQFMLEVMATSNNVLEVILRGYKRSIEVSRKNSPQFISEMRKYPKAYEAMASRHDSDAQRTINFFLQGVEQGFFRADVNYSIYHELVKYWMDVMLTTDILHRYTFLEVYESIMLTSLRGIATEKGTKLLEEFLVEFKETKIETKSQK
ncbi:MAG: TetR/AcrR family transcriptional regulator [Bacteroides sp.]|nr:TetR/AcrR family transcriptional regulator [Bacteroides sp.]